MKMKWNEIKSKSKSNSSSNIKRNINIQFLIINYLLLYVEKYIENSNELFILLDSCFLSQRILLSETKAYWLDTLRNTMENVIYNKYQMKQNCN